VDRKAGPPLVRQPPGAGAGGLVSKRPKLIYDVGVGNGDDSAYYLQKGYQVVAVEASPVAVERLRRRFAAEIDDGRYVLVPAGIAEQDGEATFWVCDDHAEWSSFDRSIASRNGARHHEVAVRTRRFSELLEEFGPATYCKIDIEGNEQLCLDDMTAETRPTFVSTELIDAGRQIGRLRELGYTRFKFISQRTFRPPRMATLKARIPGWPRAAIIIAGARLARHRRDGGWRFPPGSSGPFGEATPGRWMSADEMFELHSLLARHSQWREWFDIHAAP